MEYYEPTLNKKLREAIHSIWLVFTKVEHEPEFSGGEEGWNKFIAEFCEKHKKALQEEGPLDIVLQFIVHLNGKITDGNVMLNATHSELAFKLLGDLQNGNYWTPAVQNGRQVVSYKMVKARLSAPQ